MRLKFGLEKEFFCLSTEAKTVTVVPKGMAADSCGWLAEARGNAFTNIVDAVFSLHADIHKLVKEAEGKNVILVDTPLLKVPRDVRVAAARASAKGLISYENLYGYQNHKNTGLDATAGVHISFTNPSTVSRGEDHEDIEYYKMFDWFKVFSGLDKAFKEEIKAAKRLPGFYELKNDGRIEYRSLPANVDLNKVMDVVHTLTK